MFSMSCCSLGSVDISSTPSIHSRLPVVSSIPCRFFPFFSSLISLLICQFGRHDNHPQHKSHDGHITYPQNRSHSGHLIEPQYTSQAGILQPQYRSLTQTQTQTFYWSTLQRFRQYTCKYKTLRQKKKKKKTTHTHNWAQIKAKTLFNIVMTFFIVLIHELVTRIICVHSNIFSWALLYSGFYA